MAKPWWKRSPCCVSRLQGNDAIIAELEAAALAHASAAEEEHSESLAAARKEIEAVRALVGGWMLPKRDRRFFLEGLERCYARGRKLLHSSLADGDSQRLHEARKSVIHHLHHLEILEPAWPRMMKVWCDELGRLREALGDLNDLSELEGQLADPQTAFGKIASIDAVLVLIAARRLKLTARVRKRANQLFAERPGALARRLDAIWASWEEREAETPTAAD